MLVSGYPSLHIFGRNIHWSCRRIEGRGHGFSRLQRGERLWQTLPGQRGRETSYWVELVTKVVVRQTVVSRTGRRRVEHSTKEESLLIFACRLDFLQPRARKVQAKVIRTDKRNFMERLKPPN